MSLHLYGELTAADASARTLSYLLLPYGEPGRTNMGTVTAARGVVELPDDPGSVLLNMEHDPTRPVGRAVQVDDTDTGLVATFRVAATRAGDDLLAEVAEGLRTGVSVELDDPRIRGGALTGGRLTGAGAVVRPAFDSARVQLAAADTGDDPDDTDDTTPDPDVVDETTAADPAADDEGTDVDETTQTMQAAAAPVTLPGTTAPEQHTLSTVNRLLASAGRGDRSPQLLAALATLTQTANADVSQPGWLGEVWKGNPYQRQIVPLLAQGNLSSYKLTGWEWNDLPTGDDYAGDLAAVTSDTADTIAVSLEADRWAGAHKVDRKFRDFGDESFWSSYWQAMAASYSRWTDEVATAALVAGATSVTPAQDGVVSAIVAGVLQVIPYGTPSYCLLGSTCYAELVERDPLAFLSGTISLPDGGGNVGGLQFRAAPGIAATQVVVGTRNAATFYELGGGTPIRVDAVDVANGGVDVGAFGYAVAHVNAPLGVAKATRTTTP